MLSTNTTRSSKKPKTGFPKKPLMIWKTIPNHRRWLCQSFYPQWFCFKTSRQNGQTLKRLLVMRNSWVNWQTSTATLCHPRRFAEPMNGCRLRTSTLSTWEAMGLSPRVIYAAGWLQSYTPLMPKRRPKPHETRLPSLGTNKNITKILWGYRIEQDQNHCSHPAPEN